MLLRGSLITLIAAFIWGVGNAVTGYTAQNYRATGSLFPAVDIALANTLGGLLFLLFFLLVRRILASGSVGTGRVGCSAEFSELYLNPKALLSGALKGANTCLFVFSTTFVPATASLVFESTYIVWSLLLSVIFITRRAPLAVTLLAALCLFSGVVMLTGRTSLGLNQQYMLGVLFGLGAGVSYALFLFFWSLISKRLEDLGSQLSATSLLLGVSLFTITMVTQSVSILFFDTWWLPFSSIRLQDAILQLVNGAFVVGLVYLLVTVGLAALQNAREGASFTASLILSFSIPFTLLPEVLVGRFAPSIGQIIGIALFMVGFVLMSVSLARSQGKAQEASI